MATATVPNSAASQPSVQMPSAARLYLHGLAAAWVLVACWSLVHLDYSQFHRLLPLLIIAALASKFTLNLHISKTFVTFTFLIDLATGILFGFPAVVLTATLPALITWLPKRRWNSMKFNVAAPTLAHLAALAVYFGLDWLIPGSSPLSQVPGAVVAGFVAYACESAFVSFGVGLAQGRNPLTLWRENVRWLLLYWVGMGVIALGLARTYEALGLFGLGAFIGPVALVRYAMKQYLDHTMGMVEELRGKNEELTRANREIEAMTEHVQETYAGTLEALVAALDARDRETRGHSSRVSKLTMVLARQLGYQEGTQEWRDLERGSLLHDVGKIGVQDAILRKPGSLTDDEWNEMRRHARIGYDMLKDIPFLTGASQIVANHHERWDGKGYPLGLKGEEIPRGARIFCLADAFDAMATDRPYRRAMSYEAALAEIVRCSGTHFDPEAVAGLQIVFDQWIEIHRQGLRDAGISQLSIVA